MAAPINSLIDSLPNKEDKIEVLSDLKALLGNIPVQSICSVVANVSFSSVFDCLSTENREQLELCCDVLNKLLKALSPDVVLTQFQDEIKTGLTNDEAAVRKLCISEIERISREMVNELLQYEELVIQVVKTMADDVLEVAKIAGNTLVNIGGSTGSITTLYGGAVMSALQDILSSNDTVRFRVYEVIVTISSQSISGLHSCSESGLLQQFLNELHRDDILVQLNCLELLSDLALVEHGLTYLDQQGVLATLENMMRSSESDPLAGFLVPGLIKFFGCVARIHPKEVMTANETFVSTVFTNLSAPQSDSMHSLAIQTVGFIGSSVEGKLALEKLGNKMDTGVRCIGKALRETQHDTKIVVLQALATLLKLKVPDQTSELLKLTECWYNNLGTRTFDYLVSLADQPFPDLRIALLSFYNSLALQPWSQAIMNSHPGFREYLLDRSTEKSKEGKEGKFAIISTLANSPTSAEIFGQPYIVQLKAYCSQGPFYVRAQAEVAMEGDS
ncbi:26S proteasome non-ATPase regulatory subunit 5-like [Mercenaria mercenaria]|uniref:26S proteasome non-ATPase regulatory subunit 5-like n=1 Tax=Mercenaria mercenaria TaxID=6596 RepID=UPI00234EC433|nr:26S proteasome non-ATPase regulatory subunit 5-like [Mercenaria mercenaria]